MAASTLSVVKIGGSLVAEPVRLKRLLERLAAGAEGPVVIVPGGGPFADAVRSAQSMLGFGDRLAHRLAIDAMGQMGEVFCAIERRLMPISRVATLPEALDERAAVVWAAAELRCGHPSIPESWDVTSDSLALWLATKLGAGRCILIKSVPCPADADTAELVRRGVLDRAFPDFARAFDGQIDVQGPTDECDLGQAVRKSSSHSRPHPEVRVGVEPRISPPARSPDSGSVLRGQPARAPRDEEQDGTDVHTRRGIGDAAQ